MRPNVIRTNKKEKHRYSLTEYCFMLRAIRGENRKSSKEKSITANTRSLDGKREAISTDDTTEAFREILLDNLE